MNKESKDNKEVANDSNNAKFDMTNEKEDAHLLVNAADINMIEISLGKLAQKKGTLPHVKELGKMMEEEHTKAMNVLVSFAKSKGITIPTSQTENGQETYKKLNLKSGYDFDKAYAEMMVTGHKDAIVLHEKISTDAKDPDIRDWAAKMLPVLKNYLNRAMMCQKECDKL
jgi:putative membrane protein